MLKKIIYLLCLIIILSGCNNNNNKAPNKNNLKPGKTQKIVEIEFNADSAWSYINKQVSFGPRVPNSEAHKACSKYLASYFRNLGAEVIEQKAQVMAYNRTMLNITNIIAQFNPSNKERVILFAHWDSRPYADMEEDSTLWNTPIDGANDGGSGVGVLMEIGRHLAQNPPEIGIDIILFDAEDYGEPDNDETYYEDPWCLGSQYWAKNPHKRGYIARYGILLDMVGAKDAIFAKEGYSQKYAAYLNNKIWKAAALIGYDNRFSNEETGEIIDDHLYLNTIAYIPSIDIIEYNPNSEGYFGPNWHTLNDNMDIIDRSTLKAVGQTLIQVIYSEK
ncbi:M28 family peptidase [Bacteroidota bacterium]